MEEFFLYPKDDSKTFFELCALFEKTYPNFVKEPILSDPLDDQLFQNYHCGELQAVIILERLWFYEIILKANFYPQEFISQLHSLEERNA